MNPDITDVMHQNSRECNDGADWPGSKGVLKRHLSAASWLPGSGCFIGLKTHSQKQGFHTLGGLGPCKVAFLESLLVDLGV